MVVNLTRVPASDLRIFLEDSLIQYIRKIGSQGSNSLQCYIKFITKMFYKKRHISKENQLLKIFHCSSALLYLTTRPTRRMVAMKINLSPWLKPQRILYKNSWIRWKENPAQTTLKQCRRLLYTLKHPQTERIEVGNQRNWNEIKFFLPLTNDRYRYLYSNLYSNYPHYHFVRHYLTNEID